MGTKTRKKIRIALVAGFAVLAAASSLAVRPDSSAASPNVLVANCGSAGYLSYKPDYWSAGCTSGSPTIEPVAWEVYGGRKAVGTGTAPVQDCGCYAPTVTASYPARIVLSKPRRCRAGRSARYFSKARLTITYPAGNPFGEPAGEQGSTWHVPGGRCEFAPLRPS